MQITKQFLLVLSLLSLLLAMPIAVTAQEATDSSSSIFDQTKTENIKKLLQKTANNPNVKKVLGELSQRKRGFIGQIERVTAESLTITNSKGTEIIPIDNQVTLLKANKEISIDDLAIGDWLVIMGLIVDDAFTPKRILVSSATLLPKNHVVMLGTIVDQTKNKLTLLSRQNEDVSFDLNIKTQYQDHDGKIVKNSKFIKDLQVLIVGYENDEGKAASIIRTLAPLETLQGNE
ncbi:hypothetical protein KJ707_00195 [Patescibacteria group bacterium]|nr:hypothetical protein [Patescibacteria group bacterium]MBU1967480.1 hypothetical protein [Patescibacteria group bacterium]MBU2542977.1 hypothetical protein [Patescibacteria group bacterium]